MPRTDKSIEKCLVVKQTGKLYCVRHRVGFKDSELLQWDETTWIHKDDPRIIEVVSE